jgi:hypothetical protein
MSERQWRFDLPEIDSPKLELDFSRARVPIARFVSRREAELASMSGAARCTYCQTPAEPHLRECACCGAPGGAAGVSISPLAPSVPVPASASSRSRMDTHVLEPMRELPFGFWKRVPVYALLALVLGNGCRCAGLSLPTNIALTMLLAIGLVGSAVSFQRSP